MTSTSLFPVESSWFQVIQVILRTSLSLIYSSEKKFMETFFFFISDIVTHAAVVGFQYCTMVD